MIANRIAKRGLDGASIDFSGYSRIASPGESARYVDPETAQGLPAVWAAISLLSNVGGTLPLVTYRRGQNDSRDRATSHPAYRLLHDEPTPDEYTDAATFWPQVIADYAGWGNAFIGKEIVGGRVRQLHRIVPAEMTVERRGSRLVYIERRNGERKEWRAETIIHIRGIAGRKSLVGLSPIGRVREAIGLGLNMQSHAAQFFNDLAVPPGALQLKEKIDNPEVKEAIRRDWRKYHHDRQNIAILDNGATFETYSMPMKDAQFVELAGLTRSDVALIYNIPPSMLAASTGDSLTYGNRESDAQNFLSVSLVGSLKRIEARLSNDRDLFPQQNTFYVEFERGAFLRADMKTRYESYAIATGGKGWMRPEEVRARENLPAVDPSTLPSAAAVNLAGERGSSNGHHPAVPVLSR